ncbi:hypothetical protein GMI69_01860 [Eggerthellaceae bacterium zg-887]|uniref:hypothetical protein n=1 Tax=Xiamenia xianingshaonis TaxID=2682776 RepID=UPI00140C1B2F|nr:hypothetical protein [Xiamenia xianingshaonis]NHM15420.1 hypothetical protein [Xiamenia xianingshaonis]
MFERDYLLSILMKYAELLVRSWTRSKDKDDPLGSAAMLETAIGEATDIDGDALLSLAPESMAGVMQVSGVDSRVSEYIGRSLALSAQYFEDAGDADRAQLRRDQAFALSRAYGFDLPDSAEQIVEEAQSALEQAEA